MIVLVRPAADDRIWSARNLLLGLKVYNYVLQLRGSRLVGQFVLIVANYGSHSLGFR